MTGTASYSTHERVCALMDWASRKATPPEVRALANEALRKIEDGEPVKPLYLEVKQAYDESQVPPPDEEETDLARLAREAFERAKREEKAKGRKNLGCGRATASHYRSVRSFALTWSELEGWTETYDVDELARSLSEAEWQRFDRVLTASIAFRDQLIAARRNTSSPS